MRKSLLVAGLYSLTLQVSSLVAQDVRASLDFTASHPISPLIYGFNQNHVALADVGLYTSRRLGGNRLTAHNWEINSENSGADNQNKNGWLLAQTIVGVPWGELTVPGAAYKIFHQNNLNNNLTSIITVPIQGWVAADHNNAASVPSGPQGSPDRWNQLVYTKGSAFSTTPDLTDKKVYLEESIHFLKETFGGASAPTGVKYISLDNEPDLWDGTHLLIQPNPVSIADYVAKVIEAAKAVKAVDPDVKVIAGEFAGIGIFDLEAPDWQTIKNTGYDYFFEYFLAELKKASDTAGYNLIDIISVHFYPQHAIDISGNFQSGIKGGTVVRNSTLTADHIRRCRMDFSRSLWDDTYSEPSWLTDGKLNNQPHMLIKRLQSAADTYFPGIKVMLGEFGYGHDADISNGIATADLLAVLGDRGVEIATKWYSDVDASSYSKAAYALFRNVDGNGGTYGDQTISSTFDSRDDASVWGSVDSDDKDLHLIILNKNLTAAQSFSVVLNDKGFNHAMKGIYAFDPTSSTLKTVNFTGSLTDASLNITVPALSAYHVIISRDRATEVTPIATKMTRTMNIQIRNGSLLVENIHENEQGTLNIYNLNGRMLNSVAVTGRENQLQIDVSGLSSGRYVVQFKGTSTNVSTSFSK